MNVMSVPSKISEKQIPLDERLIFALDYPDHHEAMAMVEKLGDSIVFYKLGLELFMAGNYFELVSDLTSRGKKVFVDLKFFDVPKTVGSAIKRLREKGATFASVHGNDAILEEAVKEKGDLKILAVTVLTSLDKKDMEALGFDADIDEVVLSRADRALKLGCDGVISSGLEVAKLRDEFGNKILIVTPGIRPVENREEDDQKRVMTPGQAIQNGADYLVVGRPIRDAVDPKAAADQIVQEISEALASAK